MDDSISVKESGTLRQSNDILKLSFVNIRKKIYKNKNYPRLIVANYLVLNLEYSKISYMGNYYHA